MLLRHGNPGRNGAAGADDRIFADEPGPRRHDQCRTGTTAIDTIRLVADLRQELVGRDAELERPAVAAVGRDDPVAFFQRRGGTDGNGFLTGAQVGRARDERRLLGAEVPNPLLERPDEMDPPVEFEARVFAGKRHCTPALADAPACNKPVHPPPHDRPVD